MALSFARVGGPDMEHLAELPVGGMLDRGQPFIEQQNAQQPTVVRQLLFGRYSQPDVILIEEVGHISLA